MTNASKCISQGNAARFPVCSLYTLFVAKKDKKSAILSQYAYASSDLLYKFPLCVLLQPGLGVALLLPRPSGPGIGHRQRPILDLVHPVHGGVGQRQLPHLAPPPEGLGDGGRRQGQLAVVSALYQDFGSRGGRGRRDVEAASPYGRAEVVPEDDRVNKDLQLGQGVICMLQTLKDALVFVGTTHKYTLCHFDSALKVPA